MRIWQVMKGESRNPKSNWILEDHQYQHFSWRTGKTHELHIKENDLMIVYWPGRCPVHGTPARRGGWTVSSGR